MMPVTCGWRCFSPGTTVSSTCTTGLSRISRNMAEKVTKFQIPNHVTCIIL